MVCCRLGLGEGLETSLPIVEMPWRKGSLLFRVKTALPILSPRVGASGSLWTEGEGTPPGQTSDFPSWLENWAWPLSAFTCFKVSAAEELSPWPSPAQSEAEKIHLPVTSPNP